MANKLRDFLEKMTLGNKRSFTQAFLDDMAQEETVSKQEGHDGPGRSPEYHWNQIISKSVHRFSRRSRLKLFSIYSPGGHFVPQSGTV